MGTVMVRFRYLGRANWALVVLRIRYIIYPLEGETCGNMAEWSKAPESGSLVYLVRKGEGSNPSVVIYNCFFFFWQ